MAANPIQVFGSPEEQQAEQERMAAEADTRLLAVIKQQEDASLGGDTDSLDQERAEAIEYYLGRPFGNEIEGRSQVVSKDVFDTIEWIKPSLLRIFAGGDTVAEFQPQGEEDVKAAKQESDYVDYIIQRKNPWFMLALEWFTDALLTKNAYAHGYWQAQEEAVLERYQGLTTEQLTFIAMDNTVQIIAHRGYMAPLPPPSPELAMNAIAMGIQPQIPLHDVDVRRVKSYGCAKICVLPPERCLVAKDSSGMSVRESGFFEYWEYKSISDLRVEGFNVADDISDAGGSEHGQVDTVRDSTTNSQNTTDDTDTTADPSLRKVKTRMIWVRNDYNGDGIAELRYVVAVGDNLLANQEATSIPVASIVPYPMPHRHIGLSMYDVLGDLQLIKSAMLRAGIDNQYLANNGRTAVDKNLVNLDDMLVSRPGGIVRTDGPPGQSVMPFEHPQTVDGTIMMIEYLDGIRQDRGGVNKPYAGSDLDSIKAQPGTIAQLSSAASQKIELIARIFGEGAKELFQIVHEITMSNATMADKVQLRGEWVTVDPRTWKKRSDMTLSVGMGVGNRQQQVVGIGALLGLQKEVLGLGLTSPGKIYNALAEYTKALGFASGKQFFDEPPPGAQLPPPPPPYQIEVAKIGAQASVMVQEMKNFATQSVQTMKDEAQAIRTFFEEKMNQSNEREERMVRMFSEATERAHEERMQKNKPEPAKK